MDTNRVIGKKILGIEQQRVRTTTGVAYHIQRIHLEGGMVLVPQLSPMDNEEPAVDFMVFPL